MSTDKILIRKIGVNRHDLNGEKFTKGTTAYLLLCISASGVDYRLPVVSVDVSLRSFLAPTEISDRIKAGLGFSKWAFVGSHSVHVTFSYNFVLWFFIYKVGLK